MNDSMMPHEFTGGHHQANPTASTLAASSYPLPTILNAARAGFHARLLWIAGGRRTNQESPLHYQLAAARASSSWHACHVSSPTVDRLHVAPVRLHIFLGRHSTHDIPGARVEFRVHVTTEFTLYMQQRPGSQVLRLRRPW